MGAKESPNRGEFQEVLAALAAIDRLKSRDEVLAREANLAARKADVALRVREVYAKQGLVVSDDLIAKGVDSYFDQRLAWTKSELGPGEVFARFWVNRVRIVKVTALGVVSLVAVVVAADFGVVRPLHAHQVRESRKIQNAWVAASAGVDAAEGRLALMIKGAEYEIGVAATQGGSELAAAAEVAKDALSKTENRIQVLAAEAKTEQVPASAPRDSDGLFASSLLDGAEKRPRVLAAEERAFNEQAETISKLVDRLHRLRNETQALDGAWSTFQAAKTYASLQARMSGYRDQALGLVRQFGSPDEVAQLRVRIEQATQDLRVLEALPQDIRNAAERARRVAAEPAALTLATERETEALSAAASGDFARGKRLLAQLTGLAEQLEQTYTVRVVNRPNEYTRLWYNNPSRTGKFYYIVVEAIGPDGAVLPTAITSEQDGSTRTVRCWAERVDQPLYDEVGADKKDDGVIQNNLFAKKERGLLDPVYVRGDKVKGGDKAKGRINAWPHQQR